ncbi:hypothetical protein H5410_005851 [Solanum commersonii]|uniref:Uncharacterized protein n=1 Tax=Solanum commersonii TaxID=4109 RepID=A0A9J6A7Z6_SOLCO|nr:hypothetical protein H5410_005851 [Solanum commersonii]
MEQDIPNTNQTRMIKFGDFEPIKVNNLLSLPILSDVASVGEESTRQDEDLVAISKAKVANKKDSKLGNPNKIPNVIGAFSSKKVTPILRYVPKAKENKGHSLEL